MKCKENADEGYKKLLIFDDVQKNFEGECEKMWDTFRPNNYSLGSLYRWAKEDNPDKFIELFGGKIIKNALLPIPDLIFFAK